MFVTGTLRFRRTGYCLGKHNCPRSWDDDDTSLEFRGKLSSTELHPDDRYGVVADSVFHCSGNVVGKIMTAMKVGDVNWLLPSVQVAVKSFFFSGNYYD